MLISPLSRARPARIASTVSLATSGLSWSTVARVMTSATCFISRAGRPADEFLGPETEHVDGLVMPGAGWPTRRRERASRVRASGASRHRNNDSTCPPDKRSTPNLSNRPMCRIIIPVESDGTATQPGPFPGEVASRGRPSEPRCRAARALKRGRAPTRCSRRPRSDVGGAALSPKGRAPPPPASYLESDRGWTATDICSAT